MGKIFLHGGGGSAESFQPFIEACKRIAIIMHEDDPAQTPGYIKAMETLLGQAGAQIFNLQFCIISPDQPLDLEAVADFQPNGVFVCGGVTPNYQAALCTDSAFANYIRHNNLHYCGTSAGAAIAPLAAIVGGWRIQRGDATKQMLFQGASEGLDMLAVRLGLGLVPFSVDVHATQWGTLLRLIHAVDTGAAQLGYAIDENTMLIVDDERMRVCGEGQVYRVQASEKHGVEVTILLP